MKHNEKNANDPDAFAVVFSAIAFGIFGAILVSIGFAIVGAILGFLFGFDLFNLSNLGNSIKEGASGGAILGAKLGAIGGAIGGMVVGVRDNIKAARRADATRKAAERRAEAERKAKAEREAAERKAKAEREAEHKAKAEREARIEAETIATIQDAVKGAIRFACDAAIMNARISELEDASAAERKAAKAIEDKRVTISNDSDNRASKVAIHAAQITGIENSAKTSFDLAIQAAMLCMNVTTEKRSNVLKEARIAAIKAVFCNTSVQKDNTSLEKTVQIIESKRAKASADARRLAAASKGARIATDIDQDVVAKSIEKARSDAVKSIIHEACGHNSEIKRIVAIEALMAIVIVDAVEEALDLGNQHLIHHAIERHLTIAIKNASTVAESGNSQVKLNVPVHSYKDLPKLQAPAGYVYVIRDINHSQNFKIGRTNHPETRMNNFGVKLPFKTEVIAILKTDDAKELEQHLHRKFAMQHKRGEWFDLTGSQLRQIRNM